MKLENYAYNINQCIKKSDADNLSRLLSYQDSNHAEALFRNNPGVTVRAFLINKPYAYSTNVIILIHLLQRNALTTRYMGKLTTPWDEICIAHLLVVIFAKDNNFEEAYKEQAILAKYVFRTYRYQSTKADCRI